METAIKASELIRVDPIVKRALIDRMGAQESFNDVLRRLLEVPRQKGEDGAGKDASAS